MREYKYTVFFSPAEEGIYIVRVPAMQEICTEGDTLEEARTMAEDAIRSVIESNNKLGEPIPKDVVTDQEPIKEQIALSSRLNWPNSQLSNSNKLSLHSNAPVFFIHHQTGSHVRLIHQTESYRRVSVPMHNKRLKKGERSKASFARS